MPTELGELLASLAEMRGETRAQHAEQMRVNETTRNDIQRLITLGEEREASAQRQRHELDTRLSAISSWQLTHPTDRGAHADMRSEIGDLAAVVAGLQEKVEANSQFISDGRARGEVWGLQWKGLTVGLGAAGSLTALMAALGVFG